MALLTGGESGDRVTATRLAFSQPPPPPHTHTHTMSDDASTPTPGKVVFFRNATFVRPAATIMIVMSITTAVLSAYRLHHAHMGPLWGPTSPGAALPMGSKLWHGSDLLLALPTALCGLGLYGFDRGAVKLTRYLAVYTLGLVPIVAAGLATEDALSRNMLEQLAVRAGFWSAAWWYTAKFESKVRNLKEA